jgi:hypothetical protein
MQLATRNFWPFFLSAALLAHQVCAYPMSAEEDKQWRACDTNAECTSVEVGCYRWQPVNSKYAQDMRAAGVVACKKSFRPGPQPTSSCAAHICVNDPYTVAYWPKLTGTPQQNVAVDKRIDACLHAAGMQPPAPVYDPVTRFTTFPYAELRQFFFQKADRLIRKQAYVPDEPLESVMESAIACDEVTAKAKSLEK